MPAGLQQGRGKEKAGRGRNEQEEKEQPLQSTQPCNRQTLERSPSPAKTHQDAEAEQSRTFWVQTESPTIGVKCLTGLKAQVGLPR